MMDEQTLTDLQQVIRAELADHKPAISPNLIKWFIGTFGIFVILLAVNIGMYKIRFEHVESNVTKLQKKQISFVKNTDYSYLLTSYRTTYMWNEDRDLPLPTSPSLTRGGGTSQ